MEGALGLIGFSLGASLGMALVRTAGIGLRPLVKGAIKAGLAATDAVQGADRRAGETIAKAESAAHGEPQPEGDASSQLEPARGRRRTRTTAQKIEIATE